MAAAVVRRRGHMCSLRNLFSRLRDEPSRCYRRARQKAHSPRFQKGLCMRRLAAILTLSACASLAFAEEPPQPAATEESDIPAAEERDPELVKLESSLRFKTGDVVVGDNLATLH